jgi:hypothetical protein
VYKEHYAFKSINPNTKIWRYMSFPKFVLLLEKRALYFSLLKKLPDKCEGNRTQADINQDKLMFDYWESEFPDIKSKEKQREEQQKTERDKSLNRVNCWHINKYESAKMWIRFIGKKHEGVALQSTSKLLK